ncbi:MAG: PfkB family carbohydrate kinase [Actinomycetota bacterium]
MTARLLRAAASRGGRSARGGKRRVRGRVVDNGRMRAAVIGHVEWVRFARVPHVPASGEIVHALDSWEEPAGGGAAAAVQLAKLAGAALLFTALGDDPLGHRAHEELEARGVEVHAVFRKEPTRQAFTHVDARGERTITVLGERLGPRARDELPWDELNEIDAVYFTAGDAGALAHARRAGVLVATSRALPALVQAQTPLDALVGSASDPAEAYEPGALEPPPGLVVMTTGERGGWITVGGHTRQPFAAPPLGAAIVDRYGAGDAFAAGLTYALGCGLAPSHAAALAARCGAAALTGRGAYEGQLTEPPG